MEALIQDGWTDAGEVSLHYLLAEGEAPLTPLVYVPGSLGNGEDFRSEMTRLAPRTTVAMSPRGLGKSSAPREGYSFAQRVADLGTVLEAVDLPPVCLMAFSLGVPIAVAYAARYPEHIRGLLLLDYPARYPQRSQTWLEAALPFARERGIPEHVVRSVQQESVQVELWDDLERVNRPTLLIKGGRSRLVDEQDLARYRRTPQLQVEVFDDAGHEVFKPDYERFMTTVERFLLQLDNGSP